MMCPKMTPEARRLKGCDGPSPVPIMTIGDIEIFECPMKLIPPWVVEFLNFYGACKRLQCLPVAGGMLDQSRAFVAASMTVEGVLAQMESDAHASR